MTIGIAAAGTGGHVFPALAVAEAVLDLGVVRHEVVFFGGDRLEATAVPTAGFELVPVRQRGFSRGANLDNVRVAGLVVSATWTVRREIRKRGVRAVLAMGGYITGPAALAARSSGIPLLLHEQNAVPGLANRWAARLARRVFVAFPAAASTLPGAEVIGNPLRSDLLAARPDRAEARLRYGLAPDLPVVGIMGGSQGADALNQAAHRLAGDLSAFQLLHLAGPDQHLAWMSQAESEPRWKVVPFETEMAFFYAAADVVVARAGALTVSELAATATPSILVPYPGAAGHQAANAAYLTDGGAAVALAQSDLGRLRDEIYRALVPGERARRSAAAAALARPDAAERVAAALKEAAGA